MNPVPIYCLRLHWLRNLNSNGLWLVVIALLANCLTAGAQTESSAPSAVRTFITKDGDRLTARIINLSNNAKSITLRTSDDLDHQIETTALSLDNQIFVRDWVEAQATRQSSSEPNQVELTVESVVTKFERSTFPIDGRNITHEEMHESYRLKFGQLAVNRRAVLRVSYMILYWEKIAVYEVADGERTDWSSLSGRGRLHYRYGKFRLPVNRLSALQEKVTAPIKIDRLRGQTEADRIGHDQLIGIHVRAENPFGDIVAEFTDLPEEYAKLGWAGLNAARQGANVLDEAAAADGVLDLKPTAIPNQ